jgi:hypothetical protein
MHNQVLYTGRTEAVRIALCITRGTRSVPVMIHTPIAEVQASDGCLACVHTVVGAAVLTTRTRVECLA